MALPEIRRVVILEGVEGTGKTTLAEAMRERGWGYAHFGYHAGDEDLLALWMRGINEAADGTDSVIVDRLHLSHLVYEGDVLGSPRLDLFDLWLLEGWLAARCPRLLYMRPSHHSLHETSYRLNLKYGGLVHQNDLLRLFEGLITHTQLPVSMGGIVHEGYDEALEDTIQYIDEMSKGVFFGDYSLGTSAPRIWMVGEQHNPNQKMNARDVQGTCFSSNSGRYLFSALNVLKARWSDMHISNALKPDGEVWDLYSKWEVLKRPRVLALGNVATRELKKAGVPHSKVYHPQWWRRFKRHQVFEYAKEIRESLFKPVGGLK